MAPLITPKHQSLARTPARRRLTAVASPRHTQHRAGNNRKSDSWPVWTGTIRSRFYLFIYLYLDRTHGCRCSSRIFTGPPEHRGGLRAAAEGARQCDVIAPREDSGICSPREPARAPRAAWYESIQLIQVTLHLHIGVFDMYVCMYGAMNNVNNGVAIKCRCVVPSS